MNKVLRMLLLSAVFVSSITLVAFAAGEHDGHSSSVGHSAPESAVTQMPAQVSGHDIQKETQREGPNWPVLYGFAGINAAMITVAAVKRYVFKDRIEVQQQ